VLLGKLPMTAAWSLSSSLSRNQLMIFNRQ